MHFRYEPIPEDGAYVLRHARNGDVETFRVPKDQQELRYFGSRVESMQQSGWELLGYITPADVHPLISVPPKFGVTQESPNEWHVFDSAPDNPDSDPVVATFRGTDAEQHASWHAGHLNAEHERSQLLN